ncbi:DUF4041 domain-containing protein [Sorangium sp. So ce1097]|uniref:DUF4041 domain-containing protein n=1 Tax=Sorangium sp. So ce1097 TaxID=3133330 RepID=UPI003F60D98B
MEALLGLLLAAAIVGVVSLFLRLRTLSATHAALLERFRPIVDADAERQRVLAQMAAERAQALAEIANARSEFNQAIHGLRAQRQQGEVELTGLLGEIGRRRAELAVLDETVDLQSFGFYRPRYSFSTSERYQARLEEIRDRQKELLKSKTAAVAHTEWTVNGSVAEGRKQSNQTIKLMLRAFNGECDAAVAKVNYKNVNVMEARITKAWEAINGLASVQQCEISKAYLDLKLQELYLSHEYEEKVQADKEEQRRIKEQMREEEIAIREMEKAKQEAEREEQRYAEALRKAEEEVQRAAGAKQQKLLSQIEELQRRLAEAKVNKERAISQAQMTRSGNVYVISNIGSFGEHVYKIGMTRRLQPMDRIKELGDASVPFEFDVHAMIKSDDAPALENALHREFHHRRVNLVNERKEFFRIELDELALTVQKLHGEIEFARIAEAKEYRQTLAKRQAHEAANAAGAPPTPAPSQVERVAAYATL